MTDITKGIKLRSGKILSEKRSYYDQSDSDSEDGSSYDGFSYGGKIEPLMSPPNSPNPPRYLDLGSMLDKEIEKESTEIAIQTIEEDITSEICVPNGFGDVACEYLEKLNRSVHDGWIHKDQHYDLVVGFEKQLSCIPDDVPQKKIKRFCREAYAHVLWKTLIDGKISRRQFVSLMGRRPKFFPKKS